jgi:hypothetical protein
MTTVLVATRDGCRVFSETGQAGLELAGGPVHDLAATGVRDALAIVHDTQVWTRQSPASGTAFGPATWQLIADTGRNLRALTFHRECIFAGGGDEPLLLRVSPNGTTIRLEGFDDVPGREQWFSQGPPLCIRAMTSTCDDSALLATVHVGGIPRSVDGGKTWAPTVPVMWDVHETRAHPHRPEVIASASAVGLLTSLDGGATWNVITEAAMDPPHALAVAMLPDEALFSIQDGPFAKRSQVWRWHVGDSRAELVRDGLPDWLEGRIDTHHIAANGERAALVDGAGNVWLSSEGSTGWHVIARNLRYTQAVLVL